MYVLICGKQGSGKSAVTEKLRDYFTYRGTACYSYDYLTPVYDVIEAVKIALSQHYISPKDIADSVLLERVFDWFPACWKDIVIAKTNDTTARWDELGMHYVAIIDGAPSLDVIDLFERKGAFKVYLDCPIDIRNERSNNIREESHPLEAGFNDCAVSNIFDLVVDTSKSSPEEVANLIGTEFQNKLKKAFTQTNTITEADPSSNGSP